MTYKHIIAVASGEADDASVLAVAAQLASRFAAHIRVLPAFSDPAADLVSLGAALKPDAALQAREQIAASESDTLARLRAMADEAAQSAGVAADRFSVETRALRPRAALARAAVLSDLVLLGQPAAHGKLAGLFAEALVSDGAPCLLVKGPRYGFASAVVAWDGSPQAGRAVRAALPLLLSASRVVVLRNVEDRGLGASSSEPADLIAYLGLHGLTATAERQAEGDHVAASLLAAAREEKCDLMVAGAYGRPRLYELALGGTTKALANEPAPPHMLFSH